VTAPVPESYRIVKTLGAGAAGEVYLVENLVMRRYEALKVLKKVETTHAELVPQGVDVVSALHTVSASSLAELEHELGEDVLVCGDRKDPKQAAIALIARIEGLRPLDAGRLEHSRITESLTALMISMNIKHKTHTGIRITGL